MTLGKCIRVDLYDDFLERKRNLAHPTGLESRASLPSSLFDFQSHLVEWALRTGRCAIFADCGMGKTPMQLAWADQIVRATSRHVLILTPLAVSHQTIREAEKFGIEATRSQDGTLRSKIVVTNYERLHYFDPTDFVAVVCDESSILKSFDGTTRKDVTDFMRKVLYRLLCTATAAPNDYTELGTSSEALGHLGYMDMLNRFFKSETGSSSLHRFHGEAAKWRFKGHAEIPFWRWVCSWGRAVRKPSDLGFDDGDFVLPPLMETEHLVEARTLAPGQLFPMAAQGLTEQRQERRRTIQERCERIAELVADTGRPALVWGHLNDETDLLEKLIPGAQQVKGPDPDEAKEERFLAFARGELRVLVSKPIIGAWGLNFQQCAHVAMFPSHSYEQYYQGIRRCWRFGQQHPVQVDIVTTEGESEVLKNLQRKAKAADQMFSNLVAEMNRSEAVDPSRVFTQSERLPSWL